MATPTPAQIKAAYKKATMLHRAGRLDEAQAAYLAVGKAAPTLAEVPYQLGRIALQKGDVATAETLLAQAEQIKPNEPAIWQAKADVLATLGNHQEALAIHDRLIKRDVKAIKPRADKAFLLQRLGEFDAAHVELNKALKRAPLDGELYRMATATRRLKKGDPMIAAMLKAHADKRVVGRGRMQLQFALAKAMSDTGQNDRVFRYLNPANAAMRAQFPYDIASRQAEVDGLIAAFRDADFAPTGPTDPEFAPIFVTGLPRSGTTLAEQILASHPLVTGGGERRFLLQCAYDVIGNPQTGFTPFADLDAEALTGFANAYRDAMRRAVSFDRIVTDKSIQSHLVIGLILRAMPRAKVIVVRRDPRDLGLSIYRNFFADGTHGYAYDQEDIAAYVASFERIMRFWRETLPKGSFTEVHYEDLVADPEAQTRALVASAGLDWDDACLSFHKSERQVATLSVHQVRQPIYATSAQGWRRYETELEPMITALKREGVL